MATAKKPVPKKYVAQETIFLDGKRIRRGEVFESAGKPGRAWVPFDSKEADEKASDAKAAADALEKADKESVKADLAENAKGATAAGAEK